MLLMHEYLITHKLSLAVLLHFSVKVFAHACPFTIATLCYSRYKGSKMSENTKMPSFKKIASVLL